MSEEQELKPCPNCHARDNHFSRGWHDEKKNRHMVYICHNCCAEWDEFYRAKDPLAEAMAEAVMAYCDKFTKDGVQYSLGEFKRMVDRARAYRERATK